MMQSATIKTTRRRTIILADVKRFHERWVGDDDGPRLIFSANWHTVKFRSGSGMAAVAARFRTLKHLCCAIQENASHSLADIAELRRRGVLVDADINPMAGGQA